MALIMLLKIQLELLTMVEFLEKQAVLCKQPENQRTGLASLVFSDKFLTRAINRYERFRGIIGIRVLTSARVIRTFTQDILFSPVFTHRCIDRYNMRYCQHPFYDILSVPQCPKILTGLDSMPIQKISFGEPYDDNLKQLHYATKYVIQPVFMA